MKSKKQKKDGGVTTNFLSSEQNKLAVSSKCILRYSLPPCKQNKLCLADWEKRNSCVIPLDENSNVCQSHNNASSRLIKLNSTNESAKLGTQIGFCEFRHKLEPA